jgi:hypothetical protein
MDEPSGRLHRPSAALFNDTTYSANAGGILDDAIPDNRAYPICLVVLPVGVQD